MKTRIVIYSRDKGSPTPKEFGLGYVMSDMPGGKFGIATAEQKGAARWHVHGPEDVPSLMILSPGDIYQTIEIEDGDRFATDKEFRIDTINRVGTTVLRFNEKAEAAVRATQDAVRKLFLDNLLALVSADDGAPSEL